MFDVRTRQIVHLTSKHRYFNLDTSAENKGLECAIAYNNIESRCLIHVFISTLEEPYK